MGILEGKVAIVTGAAHGLGKTHALLLAQEGAKVVVNDLGADVDGGGKASGPADDVIKEIEAAGGAAVANYESVIDFQGAKRIIDCAIDNFGKLDILVNNAGFLRERMTFNMSEEDWDSVVDVHLKGTFNCGRWACSYFREQAKAGKLEGGRIINTVSHAGLSGAPGQPNYSAAKGGIAILTMVWAREMAKYNFTSNALVPIGRTRMTNRSENLQQMFAKAPEGEFDKYDPANVSPIVAYLASDQAKDITGRLFSMRGGILEVFIPWQSGGVIDIGRRWTVEEIAKRIHELGDLSAPQGPAI
jgi:NAD(P)-dependent dehydrogenase (short-subunit alcohol dehydrogenase family)